MAGAHFYSTAEWFALCAAHPGASHAAAVGYVRGHAAAAVPVANLTAQPSPLYRWNDLLAGYGLPTLPPSGLLVGPRQGYQTRFLVAPGFDRATGVAALVEELRYQHRAGGDDRACVAMYVTTDDARAARAAGVGAPPVLLDADAWIELPPGGWAAWLESLPAKRRANIRREVRLFEAAGYTVEQMALSECYEKLAPLAAATVSKYGHAGGPADQLAALRKHVEVMGSAAQVALCSRGGADPVAFCLYYVWDGTIFLRWAGFDYERLAGAAEYFNIVYYRQIMCASDLGVRRMHAGIKASEAKALRGAELKPLWLVDLAADSVLARHQDAVRQHNARAYQQLADDSRIAPALRDRDAWLAFC
jgi:hypothetical protein